MVKDMTEGLGNCKLHFQYGPKIHKLENEQNHDLLPGFFRVEEYPRERRVARLGIGLARTPV